MIFSKKSLILVAFAGLILFGLSTVDVVQAQWTTTATIQNAAPSFTAGPSDGGSDSTAPTNVGVAVSFTATATDSNGNQYYLAICKTNAATAGNDAAPTCPGGSWAISTATNSGSQASTSYTTLVGDAESNVWYAFVCDKLAGGGSCSSSSQGTGTTGSPFAVNHVPSISSPNTPAINPGANATFQATTADTDTSATTALYVCTNATTSFDGTNCVGGTLLCNSAQAAPGVTSCTTSTSPAPVPTSAGSVSVKMYVKDDHGFYSSATSASYTVNNVAPAISAATDSSSSATTPTLVGSNVTFTGTATDNNGDQYYLAFCKTNAITANNNAAPTCTGGNWNISAATNSGAAISSITYTALIGDAQVNAWYAFACDKVTSGYVCSSAYQGSGDPGSPFEVDHLPVIGTYYAGASYGSNTAVNPGSGVYFQVGVTDADSTGTADTINLYVCGTNSFSSGCAASQTICTVTGLASGANAQCYDRDATGNKADLVPTPTAHGSNNYYIFITDNHYPTLNSYATTSSTYSVADVTPYISAAGDYTVTGVTLIAGTYTDKTYTVTVKDDNGDTDLVDTTAGYFYDDTAINLSSGTCSADENDCYIDSVCTLSNNTSGTDNSATATCAFTNASSNPIWFNANYSSGWKLHVNPVDGQGAVTNQTDSSAVATNALQSMSIPESTINYGSLALGADSGGQTVTLQNLGNQVVDITVSGTNMCTDYPTCVGNTIPRTQQKYHHTNSTFDWASGGGYALVQTPATGDESVGCLNRDLAIRTAHASTALDENIHLKLRIPSNQASGSYSGSDEILAAASTYCTGTLY